MSRNHSPRCGRRLDSEVPTTAVRCGAWDDALDLTGSTFFHDHCGELKLPPVETDRDPRGDRLPGLVVGGPR